MDETNFSSDQIRLAVIQQLEGLRRAGVTQWKRIEPISTPKSVPTQNPPAEKQLKNPLTDHLSEKPSTLTGSTAVAGSHPQPRPLVESESSQVAKKKIAPPPLIPIPFQPLDLPLVDRIAGLAALAERVKGCTRCHELATTRTQTVFGVGNPQARIVFVGEAPGADEDAQGEPFVGRAGQLLNDIIKACRLRREEIYICNVLRCRPPGNRLPAPEEASNCREFLDGQLAHVNPEYIVCWGGCAAQNLLGSTETIGKLRGKFFAYGRAKVLCTYHPAYLMRNPAAKKDVWEDMKMLFLDMGIDLSARSK
jgi:uracil-DNA glycosylase